MADRLKRVRFNGRLRPSQKAASKVIRRELKSGERELHIVAPPGSGKTVLGLHVWADLVKRPALVLSPNSAIQAQWVALAVEIDQIDEKQTVVQDRPARGAGSTAGPGARPTAMRVPRRDRHAGLVEERTEFDRHEPAAPGFGLDLDAIEFMEVTEQRFQGSSSFRQEV